MRRLLVLLMLLPVAPAASAAESYDACAGFIDTLPATVSTQGVWCLRKDLSTAIASGRAIQITANNVTIDCNGFKIGGIAAGPASLATGIYTDKLNTTVRNCAIRGFKFGVAGHGAGHVVEDNRIDQSLNTAIFLYGDGGHLIQRNRIFDTGSTDGFGMAIHAKADIVDNTIAGVVGDSPVAIQADGWGTEVRGNRIRNLVPKSGTFAQGITALGGQQSILDNRLVGGIGEPLVGWGIHSLGDGQSFCRDNLISNFAFGIDSCEDNGGNVVHGEAPF